MRIKVFLLLLICSISIFFFTGCSSSRGIEDKAYAIALGIDTSDTHDVKISIQFAVLNSSESSSSSSGSSSNDNSSLLSVDCSSIDSGISLINSYISKQVNLSHCKAVIISEEYSSSGISDVIYTLVNNIELRPDCSIIISKCDAYDFLENSKPVFESNPAEYFEQNFNSSEYTGYLANVTLADFYYNILNTSSNASAILAGINTKETQSRVNPNASLLDDDYIAGRNTYWV